MVFRSLLYSIERKQSIDQFTDFSRANPQAASDLARLLTIHMDDLNNQKVTELPVGVTSFEDLLEYAEEMDGPCAGLLDSVGRRTYSMGVLMAKQQHMKEVEEKKKEEEVANMYKKRSCFSAFIEVARSDSDISSNSKEEVAQVIKGIDEKLESIDKDLKRKYKDGWTGLIGYFRNANGSMSSKPSVETMKEWKAFIETNHFAAQYE